MGGLVGEVVGVGVDLCEVERMRRTLERTPGSPTGCSPRASRRTARPPADPAEGFAARFAAKEAVLKAMVPGWARAAFRDIEVVRAHLGCAVVVLHDTAAALAAEHGVDRWHVSLTHTATMAEAVVIAVGG